MGQDKVFNIYAFEKNPAQDSGGKVRKYLLKSKKDAKWHPSVYTTVVPAQLWPSLRGLRFVEIAGQTQIQRVDLRSG
jgi:hypothetical protein